MKKIKCILVFIITLLFCVMFIEISTSAKTTYSKIEYYARKNSGSISIGLTNDQLKNAYNNLTTYTNTFGMNSEITTEGEIEVYKYKATSNNYYCFYAEPLYRIDSRTNTVSYWGLIDSVVKIYEVKLSIFGNYKSAEHFDLADDNSLCDPSGRGAYCFFKAKANTTYLVCVRGCGSNVGAYKLNIQLNQDYCLQSYGKNYWKYNDGTYKYDEIYYLNQEQTLALYALLYGFVDEDTNVVINADYFKSNRNKAIDKLYESLGIIIDGIDDTGILSKALAVTYKNSDIRKTNKCKVLDYIRSNCAIEETYEDGPVGSGEGIYSITINKGIIIYAKKITSNIPTLSFGNWVDTQPRYLFKGVEGASGNWYKA